MPRKIIKTRRKRRKFTKRIKKIKGLNLKNKIKKTIPLTKQQGGAGTPPETAGATAEEAGTPPETAGATAEEAVGPARPVAQKKIRKILMN